MNLLVDWGEAESAVADAWLPDRDDDLAALEPWRAASDALADALCASWETRTSDAVAAIDTARRVIHTLTELTPPQELDAKTAEGFAHYALTPEQYIAAADRFADRHAPAAVLCVGLRSIGSILAHVVAAALRRRGVAVETRSVRPRGHPFDRRLALDSCLRRRLGSARVTHVAIVDEGPGLSGSSFAAAADALIELGIAPDRIVLFPSWRAPIAALRSPRAQAAWTRHAVFTGSFSDVWIHSGRLFGDRDNVDDLSAGQWRRIVLGTESPWPAVHPQHERRKYRTRDAAPSLFRFVRLGSRGAAIAERARVLADAGFGVPPGRLTHGFLEQAWIDGRPLTTVTETVLDRMAAYLACVRQTFATDDAESIDEVRAMATTNAGQALGPAFAHAIDELANQARACAAPKVAIDGRMLPHEWIVAGDRLMKVDALDHHADDFWPGRRDSAWDVAGAIVELDLDRAGADRLVDRYQRASGDRSIRLRLPFFEAAYLAYQFAYAALGAETLHGSSDGEAFTRRRGWCRRSLAARLASSHRG